MLRVSHLYREDDSDLEQLMQSLEGNISVSHRLTSEKEVIDVCMKRVTAWVGNKLVKRKYSYYLYFMTSLVRTYLLPLYCKCFCAQNSTYQSVDTE